MKLSPRNKRFLLLIFDAILLASIPGIVFFVRFDWVIPFAQLKNVYTLIVLSVIVSIPIFYSQGLYHASLSFIGLRELFQIIKAVTFSTISISALLFIFRDSEYISGFPRSVIFIYYFFSLLGISGLRLSKRFCLEIFKYKSSLGIRTLIIGAGDMSENLIRLLTRQEIHSIVGLVDETSLKKGMHIHGYKILGTIDDITNIISKYTIESVIITLDEKKQIWKVNQICKSAGITSIKIIPSHRELVNQSESILNIRNLTIEDLLGRDVINIDMKLIREFIQGKSVLVTGAAGSIGSQLCKEILKFNPKALIAFDQNETGIFHLERRLRDSFPNSIMKFYIGTICDTQRLDTVFEENSIHVVFHAAAYKHVPLMEENPYEAIKNNIIGTSTLAEIFLKHPQAEKFIFISTDKAIRPTSLMGATKRVGEMMCFLSNNKNGKKFCAVRFGNVLDSQGNVIEIFQEMIKNQKPIEITHPEMKRYFMMTSEACLLVMEAAAITTGGQTFILDMGEPIKIVDLAHEMIRLAGYEPNSDIPIIFSKPRLGEKLFEELLSENEIPTKLEKIFIAQQTHPGFSNNNPELYVALLKKFDEKNDVKTMITTVESLVAGYQYANIKK